MVSLTNLLILLLVIIIGVVFWSKTATKNKRLLHSTAILSGMAIFSYFNSVSALAETDSVSPGAIKNFVTKEQQSLQKDLNLTPGGDHYSGIEYADRTKELDKAASDESIKETIEEYSSDNLIVGVTNGSVRLSGRVKNQDVARHILEQTKAIPGVHEITFDLGLDNKAF
jgi:hypothetical protein